MLDFEVQSRGRKCAKTDRPFEPGEEIYSLLLAEGGEVKRYDYSLDQWEGPPENCVGWWKAQVPDHSARRVHWAPNDVMLHYFEEIADQPEKEDVRYILTLLMIRRRVLKWEESDGDDAAEQMVVFSPKRETTYHVPVVSVDAARTEAIQEELAELLFSK